MPSYTKLASGSNSWNSSDDTINVYMYPNTSSMDNECENAYLEALTHMGEQALNKDACKDYNIYISYLHPNFSYSNKSDLLDKWENHDHGTRNGSHSLCVDDNFGGVASGSTAYIDIENHVIGQGFPIEHYKNGIVHETLHNYIDDYKAEDYSDHSASNQDVEHDLGVVYDDNSVSPMLTAYIGDHNGHGDCTRSGNIWNNTYTTNLTDCTLQALKDTSEKWSGDL